MHRKPSPGPAAGSRFSDEEALTALRKGAFLLKHGRAGKPKVHFFRLSAAGDELRWRRTSGGTRSVPLASVRDILQGQATENFRRHPLGNTAFSFSLLYVDPAGQARTLDLTCADKHKYSLWLAGMALAVQQAKHGVQILSSSAAAAAPPSPSHPPAPPPPPPPGDLFLWGCAQRGAPAQAPATSSPSNTSTSHLPASQQLNEADCWPRGAAPLLTSGGAILNAKTVAVGRRHAAVISSAGALYVLGESKGGKLGLGHGVDAPAPQRVVHGLPHGVRVVSAACGDDCTAAILEDGQLFMWGRLPGESSQVSLPVSVRGGLAGVAVSHVSCGPFHCAAISREGQLFTWGEGFGGKLGHGDQSNRTQPTPVAALGSSKVLDVACGVWHTAAVVSEPVGSVAVAALPVAASPRATLTSPKSLHRRAGSSLRGWNDPSMAYHEGTGGVLYTWGGVNEAVAFGNGEQRRDSNKGCLGHGDTDLYTGQLLPVKVAGALSGWPVRHVAAGSHLTVAITTAGTAYQMGSTGAAPSTSSAVQCPWEGAPSPELVRGALIGQFVDTVACGMHHVVVTARPLDKKSGRVVDGAPRSVLAWGRGQEGQLGTGKWEDVSTPLSVDSLKGRKIVHVSCGGAATAAVCENDITRLEPDGSKEALELAMRPLLALLAGTDNKGDATGAYLQRRSVDAQIAPRRSTLRGLSFTGGGKGAFGSGGGNNGGGNNYSTNNGQPPNLSRFSAASSVHSGSDVPIRSSYQMPPPSGSKSIIDLSGAATGGGGGGPAPPGLNIHRSSGMLASSHRSLASFTSRTGSLRGGGSLRGASDLGSSSSLFRSESGFGVDDISYAMSGRIGEGRIGSPALGYNNNNNNNGARSIGPASPATSALGGARSSATTSPGLGLHSNHTSNHNSARGREDCSNYGGGGGGGYGGWDDTRSESSTASMRQELREKGRYIVQLERRLESLQSRPSGGGSGSIAGSGSGVLGSGTIENREKAAEEIHRLQHTVASGAEEFRQSVRQSLAAAGGGGISSRRSLIVSTSPSSSSQAGVAAASGAGGSGDVALKGLKLGGKSVAFADTPPSPLPPPAPQKSEVETEAIAAVERALADKQAELTRQQQQLAAWAQELEQKEAALVEKHAALSGASGAGAVAGTSTGAAISSAASPSVGQGAAINTVLHPVESLVVDNRPVESPMRASSSVIDASCVEPPSLSVEGEWTEDLEPGVTATYVKDEATGATKLKRVRFSREMFTPHTAAQWYENNKHQVGVGAASTVASGAASRTASLSAADTPSGIGAGAGGGGGGGPSVVKEEVLPHVQPLALGVSPSGCPKVPHGRVDSRNMSFDARELVQLHAALLRLASPSTSAAASTDAGTGTAVTQPLPQQQQQLRPSATATPPGSSAGSLAAMAGNGASTPPLAPRPSFDNAGAGANPGRSAGSKIATPLLFNTPYNERSHTATPPPQVSISSATSAARYSQSQPQSIYRKDDEQQWHTPPGTLVKRDLAIVLEGESSTHRMSPSALMRSSGDEARSPPGGGLSSETSLVYSATSAEPSPDRRPGSGPRSHALPEITPSPSPRADTEDGKMREPNPWAQEEPRAAPWMFAGVVSRLLRGLTNSSSGGREGSGDGALS